MMSLLGLGLMGLAGSLVGGAFSHSSQSSANSTNLRIAQMNNEWSEKMMEKQNQYNIDQWNRAKEFALEQRDYDSAVNQAQRFREAGLNPALMMSSNNAGSAASTPSGSSVGLPSPSSAQVQPFDWSNTINGVLKSMEMQMQLQRNEAEINNLNAQADVSRARAAADTAWTYERLKETKVGRQFLESTFDIRKAQLGASYSESIARRQNLEAQSNLYLSQKLLSDKELSIFDEQRRADLANMIADTQMKLASKRLTKQQAIHEIQRMYKTVAETQGLKISNDVAERSAQHLVNKAEADSYSAFNPFSTMLWYFNNN